MLFWPINVAVTAVLAATGQELLSITSVGENVDEVENFVVITRPGRSISVVVRPEGNGLLREIGRDDLPFLWNRANGAVVFEG